MKNNEEKMVIVEIKPNDGTACPLLDISNEMAPVCTLDNRVPYCKECRKGFSRSEAVRIMTKVIFRELEPCLKPFHKVPKEKRGCIATAAEAALDALLGKEEGK